MTILLLLYFRDFFFLTYDSDALAATGETTSGSASPKRKFPELPSHLYAQSPSTCVNHLPAPHLLLCRKLHLDPLLLLLKRKNPQTGNNATHPLRKQLSSLPPTPALLSLYCARVLLNSTCSESCTFYTD